MGATRITPPHPLELLIGRRIEPLPPADKALMQVLPGARLACISGWAASHPLPLTLPPCVPSQSKYETRIESTLDLTEKPSLESA